MNLALRPRAAVRAVALSLTLAGTAFAQAAFPGLQSVLTDAEWKRAGLDRLTPDQIGVIDAALIRHQIQTAKAAAVASAAGLPAQPAAPAPTPTAAEVALAKARFWDRFGLDKVDDWRAQQPMVAKVTGWQGGNRFSLETGQVWEGLEPIPFDPLGQDVTIEARPMNAFALKLRESVAVRVRRLK
jgi:hypothetical protein